MIDPRELHIPLVIKDGIFVLRNGEALPDFREGTEAELRIAASTLADPSRIGQFLSEATKPFLPAHSPLGAEVNPDGVSAELRKHVVNRFTGSRHLTFVPFAVTEELNITLTAGKKGRLVDCKCFIPSLNLEVKSINEAYTRISEAFEPTRRSHTGNVFAKVFSIQPALRSLDSIRREIEASDASGQKPELT